MNFSIFFATLLSGLFSFIFLKKGIPLAKRYRFVDTPSPRKQHQTPTAIIGGICIFLAWAIGITAFSLLEPQWFTQNSNNLLTTALCLGILITIGVIDDMKGLSPAPKFFFQSLAAVIALVFNSEVHEIMLYWQRHYGPIAWVGGFIWIVGITNAINLIDGLDGLAGGTSFIVCASLLILSVNSNNPFTIVMMACVLPPIASFLKFNWHPAKVFLGDNGSLPLGFLIATMSLCCRHDTHSWILMVSVVTRLGYPLLDMGLAVFRRFRNQLPLFKADRNHLHFRVQRLGLTVPQTTKILLSISLYLQIVAICINSLPPMAVVLAASMVAFSIFTLLFIVKSVETAKINELRNVLKAEDTISNIVQIRPSSVVHIDMAPLFEVSIFEERSRYQELVSAFETMIRAFHLNQKELHKNGNTLSLLLRLEAESLTDQQIRVLYRDQMQQFCKLMQLQTSISGFSIRVERNSTKTDKTEKDAA